jgi:hypothetical protein
MYRQLDPAKIIATSQLLQQRASETFPGSGLSEIAEEFVALAHTASGVARQLEAPLRLLRAGVVLGLGLLVAAALAAGWSLDLRREAFSTLSELAQGIEAAIGDLVFLCVGVFFLLSVESRLKRRRALALLRELRAMAHIIDLHQLTKDPDQLRAEHDRSPQRSPLELTLYLNYASELLALIGKLAALLVQGFDDPVTLAAVNEIEELTNGISRKIWQKISIADRLLPAAQRASA